MLFTYISWTLSHTISSCVWKKKDKIWKNSSLAHKVFWKTINIKNLKSVYLLLTKDNKYNFFTSLRRLLILLNFLQNIWYAYLQPNRILQHFFEVFSYSPIPLIWDIRILHDIDNCRIILYGLSFQFILSYSNKMRN